MARIGVSIPFITDGRGSIEYSNSLVRSIEDSIKQIVLTKKKERVMNLDFGCDIWKLTFDDDILIIKELANEYVKESLIKWEPRIEVYEINTSKINEKIFIDIIYKIKNNNSDSRFLRIETTIGGI